MGNGKVAVFIDVANTGNLDYGRILRKVNSLGNGVEARAFGDFRQFQLEEKALEFYALGIGMIHCPSWQNGGQELNGQRKYKRSDDSILAQTVYDFLENRPDISTYALLTADADIIPAVHSIRNHDKTEIIIFDNSDTKPGHILYQCGFHMIPGPQRNQKTIAPASSASCCIHSDIASIHDDHECGKVEDNLVAFLANGW